MKETGHAPPLATLIRSVFFDCERTKSPLAAAPSVCGTMIKPSLPALGVGGVGGVGGVEGGSSAVPESESCGEVLLDELSPSFLSSLVPLPEPAGFEPPVPVTRSEPLQATVANEEARQMATRARRS
jgi:hypothetical protein